MTAASRPTWGPFDGRPLYRYRWTEDDRSDWARQLRSRPPERWSRLDRAAFCLFVAEQWRLSYEGGPWSWAPFLAPLDAREGRWVGEAVTEGLRALQRPLQTDDAGNLYLATLLPEGGLPIRLLARRGSWLPHWLGRVVRAGATRGLQREDAGWTLLARAFADNVPLRLRHGVTFEAGGALAGALTWLGKELPEAERRDPLRWLDASRPGWREALPVPVDEAGAQALVAPLLVATEEPARELAVVRFLELSPEPRLVARLDLPDPVALSTPGSFELVQPGTWWIHLLAGGTQVPAARFRRVEDGYRITDQRSLVGPQVTEEIQWSASLPGGIRRPADAAPGGHPLGDLPWVFAPNDLQRARFLGEGALRSRRPELWVLAAGEARGAEPMGIQLLGRSLYQVSGEASFRSAADEAWVTIVAGATQDQPVAFLQGRRCFGAFVGPPQVVPRGRLEVKRSGRWVQATDPAAWGRVPARWFLGGRLVGHRVVDILPGSFHVGLRRRGLTISVSGAELLVSQAGKAWVAGSDGEWAPPDGKASGAPVSVLLVGSPGQRLQVEVPPPASQPRWVDASGEEVGQVSLSPAGLRRLRVRHPLTRLEDRLLFSAMAEATGERAYLVRTLSELDPDGGVPGLDEWMTGLLDSQEELDAGWSLTVEALGEAGRAQVRVQRYEGRLIPDRGRGRVVGDGLDPVGLRVEALSLADPDVLVHLLPEAGGREWVWPIPAGGRGPGPPPGPWLVVGRHPEGVRLRPVAWPGEPLAGPSRWEKAVSLGEPAARQGALRDLLLDLPRLEDLEPVEALLRAAAWLPAPTFDLLRLAVGEARLAASLLVVMGPSALEVLERLPFDADWVPEPTWRSVLALLPAGRRQALVASWPDRPAALGRAFEPSPPVPTSIVLELLREALAEVQRDWPDFCPLPPAPHRRPSPLTRHLPDHLALETGWLIRLAQDAARGRYPAPADRRWLVQARAWWPRLHQQAFLLAPGLVEP